MYKRQNLTINLLNGNNTITFNMLNSVCAFAICLAASVGSIAVTIATIGLLNININIIDPNTLKVKCIIAALLAFLLAPILEINEVTHVPIFLSLIHILNYLVHLQDNSKNIIIYTYYIF